MNKKDIIVLGKSEDRKYTLLLMKSGKTYQYNVAYGYTETGDQVDWVQGHYFFNINDAVYFMNKFKFTSLITSLSVALYKTFDSVTGDSKYQGKSTYTNEELLNFKRDLYDAEDKITRIIKDTTNENFYLND